ncbi:DNA polymerase III subunit beta [bacterium]|nr:DNA polymerase III subunit beta [bacterium]
MKFTILSEKLKKCVSIATHLCGSNLSLPILNNILLEAKKDALQLSSTNLEIGLTINIPIETKEQGKVAIPGKIFSEFINSLPKGEIKIQEKDFILNVKCEGFKAKILGQNPKDFPVIPSVQGKTITELKAKELISSLSKVSHLVSPSDTRVEISGILMRFEKGSLKLVGTDSIRLGEKIVALPSEVKKKSVIIPQKTATELAYVFSNLEGKIKISIDPSQIGFDFVPSQEDEVQISLISRLIEGQYPEYQEVIPKETKTYALLDKEDFKRKIKIASLFSTRIQDVRLHFHPAEDKSKQGFIRISAASSEVGEGSSEIKGKLEGEEVEISFNWRYLLDGLSAMDSSEILFGVNDAVSPAIIRPVGDKTYLYVLMPKTI